MTLTTYIQHMPKVELHVHLEGSIAPTTLLALAARHAQPLPATTVEGLRAWYRFTDFPHFLEVYISMAQCLRTPDDIELIAREFLAGQAAQNVLYSEVTYTASTQWRFARIPFADQLAALNRARAWARATLDTDMGIILDIPRDITVDEGLMVADWAISAMGDGVVALGLAGPEAGYPAEKHAAAFARAKAAGLSRVPHAGEVDGPPSIWAALRALDAQRIGHGVRCLEDPALVAELRSRQVPLEVCPTSNVCLKVAPDLAHHPLPRLLAEGLYVTLNSDDPPLFDTTLTGEYEAAAAAFGFGAETLAKLVLNAAAATCLPAPERAALVARCAAGLREARE